MNKLVQRYSIDGGCQDPRCQMETSDSGAWVMWEDVELLLAASPPSGGDAVAWLIDNGESKKFYIGNIDDAEWYRHQDCIVTPLYTSLRVVDDDMLDAACEAYADMYDVEYIDGGNRDNRRACIKAALQAALEKT